MGHFRNGFISYLLFQLFEPSITRSEFPSTVHIVPGDEVFLNCSKDSFITVKNVTVLNMGNCGSRHTDCNLNSNDQKFINECDGSPNCLLNGSLLTSACLWDDLHFDISYICKASYEYVGCYVDDPDRVLDEEHKNNQKMSADICFGICTEYQTTYKHVYFGTQFKQECFCGNGQSLNSKPYLKKQDSECNLSCLQHEDEKCGGSYKMSVYKIEPQISTYYRCLKVDQQNRIQDCKTYRLQEKEFCVKFDVSSTDISSSKECTNKEYRLGHQLHHFCENTKCNRNCVYNLTSILPEIDWQIPTKYISIGYSCKGTSDSANENRLRETSQNSTGIVVGSVVGSVLFVCLVFIGICIGRRFIFCAKSKEKLRNSLNTNDYVGNQDIALSQAVSPERHVQYEDLQTTSGNRSTHNYSSTNIHLQNIDNKYDYANNIDSKNSKILIDKTSSPTYVVLYGDNAKPNPESNDDEYAVVDPSAESSFTKTPKPTTPGTENYMILDPSQTGINRSKFPNTDQTYELPKPINDTRGHKDDKYALFPEGTYDHSGITRHRKDQDTIYTHAVDNVYDSASRGVNIARKEDTYDHFFGKETEDEYNIAIH